MKRILIIVIVLMACLTGKAQIDGLTELEAIPTLIDADGNEIGRVMMKAEKGLEVSTNYSKLDDNTSMVEFTFTAKEDVSKPTILLAFAHVEKPVWWMMPATKYNSRDKNLSLQLIGKEIKNQYGLFSFQRMNIYGAAYTEGEKNTVGTWTDEACSSVVYTAKNGSLHVITWPEKDVPVGNGYELMDNDTVYGLPTGSRSWELGGYRFEPKEQPMLKKGEKKVLHMYIHTTPVEPNHAAMGFFLRTVWDNLKTPKLPTVNSKKVWKTDIETIKGYGQKAKAEAAILANALLSDYLQKGGKESLTMGLEMLEGLLGTEWRSLTGRQQAELAVGLLRADAVLAQCGQGRPECREMALRICNYIVEEQYSDGVWNKVGPYYLPALLAAYEATEDKTFLQAARKGFEPYMAALRGGGEGWWWGPVDRNSAYPLLQAALRLYKHTGEDSFLQDAVLASGFLSTWLWHYDVDWPVKDGVAGEKYHTFGLSRPSTDCPQFDIEACRWVPEWMELAKLTGDRQWQEKAEAVWSSSAQIASQTREVRPVALQLDVMQRIKEKGYKL